MASGGESATARTIHPLSAGDPPPSVTGRGIRQEEKARDRGSGAADPSGHRGAADWKGDAERRIEGGYATPAGRSLPDDQQPGDGRRVPATIAGDLAREPALAIERREGRLGVRDDGLRLDYQHGPAGGVPRQDIDRPTLAELAERDFDGALPASSLEADDDELHQPGVRFVQQPIEAFAMPSDTHIEIGAEDEAHPLDSTDVDAGN